MPAKGEELRKTVLEYLNSHNTMTVATSHKNIPWMFLPNTVHPGHVRLAKSSSRGPGLALSTRARILSGLVE